MATFLGTMGLPHVVVRFYTNPDGRAARRTTLAVLALLGVFYLLPPVYGALGRLYAPDLVASGRADTVVLELPARMIGGLGGELLSALTTAGAFAAFLSTSSGLTIAVAGVVSQDVVSRRLRPITAFRVSAVIAVVVPLVLALAAPASASPAPSGSCSRSRRRRSARCWCSASGGGGSPTSARSPASPSAAPARSRPSPTRSSAPHDPGWVADLLGQPAAWTVPLAFPR